MRILMTFLFFASLALPLYAEEEQASAPISYRYTGADAASTLADALVKADAGAQIKTHLFTAEEEALIASAAAPIDAQVDDLDIDRAHNRFKATLILTSGGKNLAPVKVAGRFDSIERVPELKRRVQPGEVIGVEDIILQDEPSSHLQKMTAMEAGDLVGKSPKHTLSPGRPIRAEEVTHPSIITRGAHITLEFRTPNLDIRTLGEAMDSGAKGDVIRVKNITSKTIVQGTVESGDRVRVSSPDAQSAEAM